MESGESYEDALERELMVELRLDLTSVRHSLVGYLTPHNDGVSAFMKVYKVVTNETPGYNSDDFLEGAWVSPQEPMARLRADEPAKGDLAALIERFYITDAVPRGRP